MRTGNFFSFRGSSLFFFCSTTVDTDGSGAISATELASLNFGGKPIGLETARRLIRIFDRDRNGEIDFQEYCSLHSFLGRVYSSFLTADADKSLRLDPPEILTAMQVGVSLSLLLPFLHFCSRQSQHLGFSSISQSTIEEVIKKYDPTRAGITISKVSAC
jgi:Ca2+-binding EF-hand superfamily protein